MSSSNGNGHGRGMRKGWKRDKLIRIIRETFSELAQAIDQRTDIPRKIKADLKKQCRERCLHEIDLVKKQEGLYHHHPSWMKGF